jgi:hypothetical protein
VSKHASSMRIDTIIKKGKIIGIGQVMPKIIEIIRMTTNQEGTYRLLSAVVHAHFWALKNLSFKLVSPDEVPINIEITPEVSLNFVVKGFDITFLFYFIMEVIHAFGKLIWSKFLLFGWDVEPLATIFEKIYDDLHIKTDKRFWRNYHIKPS